MRSEHTADKERLLSLLLAAEAEDPDTRAAIQPRGSQAQRIPVSSAQERLWLLDRLSKAGPAYNVSLALRLVGELAQVSLERSFQTIVDRHEILRTRIAVDDGEPYQWINPPKPFHIHRVALDAHVEPDAREHDLQRAIKREMDHHFELEAGPLLKVTLIVQGRHDHVLVVVMHHIVADGWSLSVLVRELNAIYTALSRNEPIALPSLPIQYADFSLWQRSAGSRREWGRQLDYWRSKLEGAPPHLQLPIDHPRPRIESFRGAAVNFSPSPTLATALEQLARREGATLFMVWLALYEVLLSRWTGQRDIVVGTPVAGRDDTAVEDLIGFFVNTLVLRTDLSGNPTFRELLTRVKDTTLDANANQLVSFSELVEHLRPDRDLSRQPLVQATLVFQNYAQERIELPNLKCDWIDIEPTSAHFDLTLHLFYESGQLCASFQYATDLFDRRTIERMGSHLLTLAEAVVHNADCRLHQLSMLSAEERQTVLVKWNDTQRAYPEGDVIHGLFEQQVVRSPEAVALTHQQHTLTYRELNERANQLAWYLKVHAVRPDSLVAIFLERSVDMVVAMLGVLKAGGAYVPLDVANPIDRLDHILKSANPLLLLTNAALAARLPPMAAQVIALDERAKDISTSPTQNPDVRALKLTPRHLAYVIFTSGSTGAPKGVMIEHRSIVNYSSHISRQLDVGGGEGSLICTSIGFDLALTGLFPALLCGKSIRLCEEERGLPAIASELRGMINVAPLKLTPSHLGLLEPALRHGQLAGKVRCLVLGGEQLQANLIAPWRQHAPTTRIFNHYGPTETTVGCVVHEMDDQASGAVPIGRPIANMQVYILDEHLQPTPIGVIGEIYVAGVGVARGYLHREDLTNERFLLNPFPQRAGERMYRTGDLGRWRSDGVIEFFGRNDRQVKIRGHRIELGDIEAQLSAHAQVKNAVVVLHEYTAGNKTLVAYVTLRGAARPSANELRSHVRTALPDYMVPSSIAILDHVPITANGKLDLRSLPTPSFEARSDRIYHPPQGPTEQQLATIWQEVLQVERVGRDDDFFELGGHSLLGIKLTARVSERFMIELSAIEVFRHPTVRDMTKLVESLSGAGSGGSGTSEPALFDEGAI